MQEIPFSYRGSWFNFSPVIAEKTYADDVHLVSHQTGMHPVLRLVPAVDGAGRRDRHRHPRPADLAHATAAGSTLAYEIADTVRVRGTRPRPAHRWPPTPTLTPFSGPYLFRDPVDGVLRLHRLRDRPPLPHHRPRRRIAEHRRRAGARHRRARRRPARRRQPWEIAIEEYETARAARTAATVTLRRRWPRRRAAEFAAFVDAVAPWRGDRTPRPPNWPRTCCGRPPSPRRASSPGRPC